MDIIAKISEELGIKRHQTEAAVKLIDEGNTIPFIARYRKEATGALNDEVLRNLSERLTYLRGLEERKETVLASIEEQGKLTDELKAQILSAETMVLLEDLYRPYKPKRRTRATIAKEKGLEPLAGVITLQMIKTPLIEEAAKYVDAEKGVTTAEEAIAGASDIIAESISDEADYRTHIRDLTVKKGRMTSTAKDPETESVYEMYYDFDEPVAKLAGHRILAVNRGEKEKFLTVKIEAPQEDILRYLEANLAEDISIDDLAAQFFISKYHMMRRFREETGTSIHNYLSDKRLLAARDLIQSGLSATDACFRCGFRSYSAFSRAYGKLFGATPTGRIVQTLHADDFDE